MLRAISGAALLLLTAAPAFAGTSVKGEYVEARTCNVYIGACHANGERVTSGREAMLAWNIREGAIDGVKVGGLKAVAIVVGKTNLADCGTGCGDRKTVLYVDSKANPAQREAIAWALQDKYGKALGSITAVKSAPIEFTNKGLEYTVRIPEVAQLKTTRYACDHCVMPHEVWYKPFIEVKNSLVAMASINEFKGAPELNTKWLRTDENSSFVGEFSLE